MTLCRYCGVAADDDEANVCIPENPDYPAHQWDPQPAGRDRAAEVAWIQANHSRYSGKWVALLGEEVIGIGDDLKTVLRIVQEKQLRESPVIHRIPPHTEEPPAPSSH